MYAKFPHTINQGALKRKNRGGVAGARQVISPCATLGTMSTTHKRGRSVRLPWYRRWGFWKRREEKIVRALAAKVQNGALAFDFGWGACERLPRKRRGALQVIRKIALVCWHLVFWPNAVFVGATTVTVLCFKAIDPAATVLMGVRKFADGWAPRSRVPIPLANVPKYQQKMLIYIEDGNFYKHWGIDFEGIQRALKMNKAAGRNLYGGSTLSMQVARTMFLIPEKSMIRKYLELIVTFEMELLLGKERILELYFNYAEWGMGVYGLGAAAKTYYKTTPDGLSKEQAARLFALLSSPLAYSPKTLSKRSILQSRYNALMNAFVR
jgi:monofunctional biosynthetic peptidoglycan transglycosylase